MEKPTQKPNPQSTCPKYIIPLFCVPKRDKMGTMTALRMVRYGSYHTLYTTSINMWINPLKCKMDELPNIAKYVRVLRYKKFMSLRDLSDAFRQILARLSECTYLGYAIFGMYFRDRKQPYGISSAAANCQSFAME